MSIKFEYKKKFNKWFWKCASLLRGEENASKHKGYTLSLILLKYISDFYEDEFSKLVEIYEDNEIVKSLIETDQKLVRFYIPEKARWKNIQKQSTNLGEYLTDAVRAIASENPKLQGVIDRVDFNATEAGQRIVTDESLKALINELSKHRLSPSHTEPALLEQDYEYILYKFAEQDSVQPSNINKFYTPRKVAELVARLIDPEPGQKVYDPCIGTGGLLIKEFQRFKEEYGDNERVSPLRFYGQEKEADIYVLAKINFLFHRLEVKVHLGDSIDRPAFTKADGSLQEFHLIISNPIWNQSIPEKVYENDPYNRFIFGYPPPSRGDWGWVQHMYASLNEVGRMAVVLDTGAVSRGSGTSGEDREWKIRKAFVEQDLIEAVILLPESLFHNKQGIILIINKRKRYPGEILLIDSSCIFEKTKNPIMETAKIYFDWQEKEGLSAILKNEQIAQKDYYLSPVRHIIFQEQKENILPPEEALAKFEKTEDECLRFSNVLKTIFKELDLIGS